MPRIILINGKKRSGKDYFAQLLQKELYSKQKTSAVLSFADPIKDMICTLFCITDNQLDEYKNNSIEYKIDIVKRNLGTHSSLINYTNFRVMLQRLGTEVLKPWFGEDVWVRLLKEKVDTLNVDYVIVPDFRFKIEHISDNTIKIFNDEIESNDLHRSETELDDFDFKYVINNTGKPNLEPYVEELVECLLAV